MSSVTLSLLNGHTTPPSEAVINLKDGSVYSKFLDLNFESGGTQVLFEFPRIVLLKILRLLYFSFVFVVFLVIYPQKNFLRFSFLLF